MASMKRRTYALRQYQGLIMILISPVCQGLAANVARNPERFELIEPCGATLSIIATERRNCPVSSGWSGPEYGKLIGPETETFAFVQYLRKSSFHAGLVKLCMLAKDCSRRTWILRESPARLPCNSKAADESIFSLNARVERRTRRTTE